MHMEHGGAWARVGGRSHRLHPPGPGMSGEDLYHFPRPSPKARVVVPHLEQYKQDVSLKEEPVRKRSVRLAPV
jgi:hypothetical protein